MTFEELVQTLDGKVRNGVRVKWNAKDMANCKSDEYKMGIYYVLNKKDQVVYIGMVGDGNCTNLYDRCFGHGWGSVEDAKEKRCRIKDPLYVLFRKFGNDEYCKAQLKLVKRLLIWKIKPEDTKIPIESDLLKEDWQSLTDYLIDD